MEVAFSAAVPGIRNLYINPSFPEGMALLRSLRNGALDRALQGVRGELRLVEVYARRRNVVAAVEFAGKVFVVKRFRDPGPLRGLFYRFCRESKSRRAVRNAYRLMAAGFRSAMPVLSWDVSRAGRLAEGWLVTERVEGSLISAIRDDRLTLEKRHLLMRDLSLFMVRLHTKGFIPLDFNIGNIFFFPAGEEGPQMAEDFSLIDINRMKSGKVPSFREAMRSFDQLGLLPEEIPFLLAPYAKERHLDIEACYREVLRRRRVWRRKKRLLHPWRLLKPSPSSPSSPSTPKAPTIKQ